MGSYGLLFLAIAVAYALLTHTLRRPAIVATTGLAIAAGEIASGLLKAALDRPRPFVGAPDPEPLVRQPGTASLPSGHATVSFACATVLAAAMPRLAVPLYLLAAAVAWSRVVVGVHYPFDVLAGAALGAALGLALLTALRMLPAARRRSAPPQPPA